MTIETKTTTHIHRTLLNGDKTDETIVLVTRGDDRRVAERRVVDTSVEDIKRQLKDYEREIYTLRGYLQDKDNENGKV